MSNDIRFCDKLSKVLTKNKQLVIYYFKEYQNKRDNYILENEFL